MKTSKKVALMGFSFLLIVLVVWNYSLNSGQASSGRLSIDKKLTDTKKARYLDNKKAPQPQNSSNAEVFESIQIENEPESLPHKVYLEYIDAANNGSNYAQYRIVNALDQCDGWGIGGPPEGYLRKKELQGYSTDELSEIRGVLDKCEGIFTLFPDKDLKTLQDAWLETAAEDGYVFAVLDKMRRYEVTKAHELEPLLYDALAKSEGDPVLRESALFSVLSYYSEHLEKPFDRDSNDFRRGVHRDGFDILYCRNSPGCDLPKFEAMLREQMFSYEVDEALKKADELDQLIASHNWEALELKKETVVNNKK